MSQEEKKKQTWGTWGLASGLATFAVFAESEVIIVNGCPVDKHIVDLPGGGWRCDWNETPTAPGGGSRPTGTTSGSHDRDPHSGGGNGGGDGDETEIDMACDSCRVDGNYCRSQVNRALDLCRQTSAALANRFCNAVTFGVANTQTPWGFSIKDLIDRRGNTPGVEPDWAGRDWSVRCRTSTAFTIGGAPVTTCSGGGIGNCNEAWRVDHPSLNAGTSNTQAFNVSLQRFGATLGGASSETSTLSFGWGGRNGWASACATMAIQLSSQCTSTQLACENEYRCEEE